MYRHREPDNTYVQTQGAHIYTIRYKNDDTNVSSLVSFAKELMIHMYRNSEHTINICIIMFI